MNSFKGLPIDIKTSGWYRFAKTNKRYDNTETLAITTLTLNTIINIQRSWRSNGSETHCILFSANSKGVVFKPILDQSGGKLIDKIRAYMFIEKDGTVEMCLDIHYSLDIQNWVYFEGALMGITDVTDLLFITPTLVPDQPDDLKGTIYEHSFKTNSWLDGEDAWPLT